MHTKLDTKCSLFKGGEDHVSISLHLGNKSSTAPCRCRKEVCSILIFPIKSGNFTCYYQAYCIVLILHDDLVTAYGTGRHNSLELRGFFRSNESNSIVILMRVCNQYYTYLRYRFRQPLSGTTVYNLDYLLRFAYLCNLS